MNFMNVIFAAQKQVKLAFFPFILSFFLCKNNTNVNFSHDYIIYGAFIMETSHDSNTDRAVWALAKFVFYACHLLQSILIDACVLDSDSGLLQQVQTCWFYLPFILTHKYLMLVQHILQLFPLFKSGCGNMFSGSDSSVMQALCSTWIF